MLLGLRGFFQFLGFPRDLRLRQFPGIGDGEPLSQRHRAGARGQTRKTRDEDSLVDGTRARDTHYQTEVGDQAIIGPSTAARRLLPEAPRCHGSHLCDCGTR